MRWDGQRESENVEDVRGQGPGPMIVGGGIGTIVILLVATFLGADPRAVLRQIQGDGPPPAAAGGPVDPDQEQMAQHVRLVLGNTEDVWTEVFNEMGKTYQEPTLVLFSGGVRSGCGGASSAMGPFYCPLDQKVYIDLEFYEELKRRYHAPGDFAQAYVIAHEVGHHVQNLLGISDRVQELRANSSEEESNNLSVRLELQADYLAGVWAKRGNEIRNFLEPGDIAEAIRCAEAIGDDALQRQAQGYVVPDSFTHGTSEQRARWFMRGYKSGNLENGDTFNARNL